VALLRRTDIFAGWHDAQLTDRLKQPQLLMMLAVIRLPHLKVVNCMFNE
jgi:hypothetical protein